MTGFDPLTSVIGSDRSTNCAHNHCRNIKYIFIFKESKVKLVLK